MAYSGKQSFTGAYAVRDLWTYLIRFVVDSGYWSIIFTGRQTEGTDTYSISQDITVTALDTWLDLTSADAYDEVATLSGTELTPNTDYEIDINLGRIKFLSTGSIQQNDLVHIDYTWERHRLVLSSTGVSGNENIYIGLLPYIDSDGVRGRIEFKSYKYWQEGMSWWDTSLGCPYNNFCTSLWNSDTDLWLFVNKQRIIAVSCIQTVYSSAYLGFFNRFAMPHEYNYPLCIITSDDIDMNYDSTSGDRQFIINGRRLNFMQEQNLWKDWHSGNPGVLLPIQRDTDNLIQIHYPADAPRCLMPVYIYADGNIYGQLDDVYFIPGAINTSESEITVGGDTYICFENVFRHGWADFMAIKEA